MVLLKTQSINYFRLSCSLWFSFSRLAFTRTLDLSSPRKVADGELLGRALFSGHYKKGKVLASAFMPKQSSRDLSTNRLSCAPIELYVSLSKRDANTRSIRSGNDIGFYGFAVLKASELRGIELDGAKCLDAFGTPSIMNPLHADITLPEYEGKDYDLLVADQLIDISRFEPHS